MRVNRVFRHRLRLAVRLAALCLLLALGEGAASAASNSLSYGGRLVEANGQAVAGPVELELRFFRSAAGSDEIAITPLHFADVKLADGVFQVDLNLSDSDFNAVFPASMSPAWIQVKDLTHNKTYPRQRFSAVPMALRVPIDEATLSYTGDGKLSVGQISAAQVSGLASDLGDKADSAAVTALQAEVADKADTAAMTAALAAKADAAATAAALAGKADASHAHTLTGDVSGDMSTTTVTKLQGVPVDSTAPSSSGQVLKWDGSKWAPGPDDGGVAGAISNGSNLGTGSAVFKSVSAPNMEFRSLSAGSNVSLTTNTNDIAIATTPSLASSAQAGFVAAPYGTAAGNTGELRFQELAASGSNHVALKAPDALAVDVTYTLPDAAPATDGDVLSGTTSGGLSWISLPASLPPSGSAGGALTGSYPNPTIAANAITSAELAADSVGSSELAADSVGSGEIAADAVGSSELADGAVITAKLAAGAVDAGKLAADAVTSAKIAADTIVAADIAAGAVTSSELAADAVTSAKIQDGQVQTADLAAGAVTTNEIADGTIAAVDLASDAVSNAKLADNAVSTAEIADGAVTNAKLASGIDGSKITAGSIPLTQLPTMAASGAAHAPGLVPDPPASSGTLRLLREDATWAIPSSLSASDGSPSQALVVDAAGNVGIGASTPETPLHVVTSASLSGAFVSTAALGSASGSGLTGYVYDLPTAADQRLGFFLTGSKGGGANAYHGAGMAGFSAGAWTVGSSYPSYLTFETAASGSTARSERLRITSTGNVGIGTSAPSTTFHVVSSDATWGGAAFESTSTTAGNWSTIQNWRRTNGVGNGVGFGLGLYDSSNAMAEYGYIGSVIEDNTAGSVDGAIVMIPRKDGARTEAMRISSSGNVGIGTTSPAYELDTYGNVSAGSVEIASRNASATAGSSSRFIAASSTANAYLEMDNYQAASPYAYISAGSADTGGMYIDVQANAPIMFRANGGSEKMRLTGAGYLGIGTTSPGTKLEVAGGIKPGNVSTGASCAGNTEGSFGYDASTHAPVYCSNSGTWTAIAGASFRTSCPAGFTLIGTSGSAEAFCISSSQETSATWLNAATTCYGKSTKARLCSTSEWVMACVAGASGPNNMTGHWEWAGDVDSYTGGGGTVLGSAGCGSTNYDAVSGTYGSRCCFR